MIQFDLPKERSSIIKVIGVGGGGSNAVNHMYRLGIKGVEFLVCNTDHQALDISPVPYKIQLGPSLTEGRGAGAIPEVGKNAAIENIDELKAILRENTKMVFITAGMGGGTGTGAAPIIAGVAREMGILTVGIVTIPFAFEGKKRKAQADAGIEELKQNVDTLLVICNEKLREIHGNLKLTEAFGHADNILAIAAKSIAEIITSTMHINVDFADIQTVMKSSGVAIMGSASAEGENRAIVAVQSALDSPLLNDNEIEGARYILLNITSGDIEVTMDEMGEITDFVQEKAGMTAEVIMGVGKDDTLGDRVGVTIIATGFRTKDHLNSVSSKPEEKVVYGLDGEIKNPSQVKQEEVPPTKTNVVSPQAAMISPALQNNSKPLNTPTENPIPQCAIQKLSNNIRNEEERIVHQLVSDEEVSARATLNESKHTPETVEPENISEPTLITREPQVNENEAIFVFEVNSPVSAEAIPEPVSVPTAPVPVAEPVIFQGPPPVTKQIETVIDHDDPFHKAQERIRKLREMNQKFNSPAGLVDLEKEPAYKRKNVQLNDVPNSSDTEVSRYTLSNDKDNKPEIKSNNSFLHDRVD